MHKPYLRRAVLTLAVMPAAFMAPNLQASPFDLPPLDSIVKYQPKLPLQVFTADGVEIAQFGAERRRVPAAWRSTPKLLQQAAAGGGGHALSRAQRASIPRAWHARWWLSMLTGGRQARAPSTITQQLVRTMLLTHEFLGRAQGQGDHGWR